METGKRKREGKYVCVFKHSELHSFTHFCREKKKKKKKKEKKREDINQYKKKQNKNKQTNKPTLTEYRDKNLFLEIDHSKPCDLGKMEGIYNLYWLHRCLLLILKT